MSQNRAANKELRTLLAAIEAAGATVTYGHRGHWKVYLDGVLIATVSGTHSDRNAHHNARRDLRRAGLDVRVPR